VTRLPETGNVAVVIAVSCVFGLYPKLVKSYHHTQYSKEDENYTLQFRTNCLSLLEHRKDFVDK